MDIIDAIKTRRSVRTYASTSLDNCQSQAIIDNIKAASSPFGGCVTIRLRHYGDISESRPGTYGVIKGATDYLLMATGPDDASLLSAGFLMEQVVLEATRLGLGTCWIGGTFRGSSFDAEAWPQGESLRIISPIDPPAKPRLMERMMRSVVRSNRRKPFDTLFFSKGMTSPLPSSSELTRSLMMMRLAPSSVNSQPWRAFVSDGKVTFCSAGKGPLSLIDMGIGLCHFALAERYDGHMGSFSIEAEPPLLPEGLRYVASYCR
ncbi:MAG: nitroreductase family protein [Pseudoflavonifractor sp.]|nr:nitroreductase family protein [Alloprevotella sp.]MCM1116349.1 nitroreductase family protein [Pseudoflavonifractor sp.]